MTLLERRHLLEDLIEPAEGPIQFSHRLEASADAVYRAVDRMGLEGMVSKQIESRYRSGPSIAWLRRSANRNRTLSSSASSGSAGSRRWR
jgi:ATP-dependent DNA ligase